MAHIVCLVKVNAANREAEFIWSQGPASFQPYTLKGQWFQFFEMTARKARDQLAEVVVISNSHDAKEDIPAASGKLAQAGHQLYRALFNPGANGSDEAKRVQTWLELLRDEKQIETLEIVLDCGWPVPWNLLYDQPPDLDAFTRDDPGLDHWRPFWGLRYNLAGGQQVDPLRRMPLLNSPRIVLAVDSHVLPAEELAKIEAFQEKHQLTLVKRKDELAQALSQGRPDLLYLLCHATPEAFVLDDEEVSPFDLMQMLPSGGGGDMDGAGIAFLNACRTAEAGEYGSYIETFHGLGFGGIVGTEQQTINLIANRLGLKFLERFLAGERVGKILHDLRKQELPLGLVYGTYCPPDLRIVSKEDADLRRTGASVNLAKSKSLTGGIALGQVLTDTKATLLPPLPEYPYRSLAFFKREDRALFAGREDDVDRFAAVLGEHDTRMIVLHGESGVGKSSFLRAGVIPYLEDECVGFRFMRATDSSRDEEEGDESILMVRATNDLFGQLADVICRYCSKPFIYTAPTADTNQADLPSILTEFVGTTPTRARVRKALMEDVTLLTQIFTEIGRRLPHEPVLVIDQAEEMFTLSRTDSDEVTRGKAIEMLRHVLTTFADFKLIISLRTEYHGRLIDGLRGGRLERGQVREYLLTDFDHADLVEAIARPTRDEVIPYSSEIPYDKYDFEYEDGLPEEIAYRVLRFTARRRDSALPLVQVMCSQLYQRVTSREDNVIRRSDLEAIGGVEGGLRSNVESLLTELTGERRVARGKFFDFLAQLNPRPTERIAFRRIFTRLYLRQADSSVTTALLPEEDLQAHWTGRMDFSEMLQQAKRLRLLRTTTFRTDHGKQQRGVSLGHDALAKLAAEWDENLSRYSRRRKIIFAVAACVALLFVGSHSFNTLISATIAKRLADQRAQVEMDNAISAVNLMAPMLEDADPAIWFAEVAPFRGEHAPSHVNEPLDKLARLLQPEDQDQRPEAQDQLPFKNSPLVRARLLDKTSRLKMAVADMDTAQSLWKEAFSLRLAAAQGSKPTPPAAADSSADLALAERINLAKQYPTTDLAASLQTIGRWHYGEDAYSAEAEKAYRTAVLMRVALFQAAVDQKYPLPDEEIAARVKPWEQFDVANPQQLKNSLDKLVPMPTDESAPEPSGENLPPKALRDSLDDLAEATFYLGILYAEQGEDTKASICIERSRVMRDHLGLHHLVAQSDMGKAFLQIMQLNEEAAGSWATAAIASEKSGNAALTQYILAHLPMFQKKVPDSDTLDAMKPTFGHDHAATCYCRGTFAADKMSDPSRNHDIDELDSAATEFNQVLAKLLPRFERVRQNGGQPPKLLREWVAQAEKCGKELQRLAKDDSPEKENAEKLLQTVKTMRQSVLGGPSPTTTAADGS